jgi:RNA polymerase sigma factor (sigma-70 family)
METLKVNYLGTLGSNKHSPVLDLLKLESELLLIERMQKGELAGTFEELMRRYSSWRNQFINVLASQYRLAAADLDEVHQWAILAFWSAIMTYDIAQVNKTNGCSFKSYLRTKIKSRFFDFFRNRRRAECHFDRSVTARHTLENATDQSQGIEGNDPVAAAQRNEEKGLLKHAREWLGEEDQNLCGLIQAGMGVSEIAKDLGITYKVVWGREKRLFEKLSALVVARPWVPGRDAGLPASLREVEIQSQDLFQRLWFKSRIR